LCAAKKYCIIKEQMASNNTTAQGFVYLWMDSVHHMFYLGSHKGMPTDNYAHSSRRMPKFRMDSVPPGYRRIILAQGNYADMMLLENRLLKKRYRNPLYYNICVSFPGVMYSDKWSKLKQSKKMKQRWSDPSRRQNLIEQIKFSWTAVRKQQTSERIKRLCADPEFYKKRCKTMKRISNDPTIKFKASERMKNRYVNTIERLIKSKRITKQKSKS
jgi:hypothetical protein